MIILSKRCPDYYLELYNSQQVTASDNELYEIGSRAGAGTCGQVDYSPTKRGQATLKARAKVIAFRFVVCVEIVALKSLVVCKCVCYAPLECVL